MSLLTLETKKYAIKIDNFEGPLDLLCHLIDKNKMNISDINITKITEQYISFLKQQEELNLEIASEFLVMASTLMYIKSKKMLPKLENDEDEITEEELINRIIEYKKFKEISKTLLKDYLENSNRFFKEKEDIKLPKKELDEEYNKDLIPQIYEEIMKKNASKINQNAKNIEKIALVDNYTVSSKVKEMIKVLLKEKKFIFNRLYKVDKKSKQEVVTAFSGLLELSRRSKVETKQEALFSDIYVGKINKNK